jgi:SAM-dependent methyltransferase
MKYDVARRIIKQFTPPVILTIYKRFRKNNRQNYKFCPVCNTSVSGFMPNGHWVFEGYEKSLFPHSPFCFEMPTLFNNICPSCGSSNRSRLYAIYLKDKFEKENAAAPILFLDVAPQPNLSKLIRSIPTLNYRSCDLNSDYADDKVDIQDMNIYPDNSFDVFICSHVLEHVEDDYKAMLELHRILKPGGWGIVMVPILLTLENIYENSDIKDAETKWKHFGQGDHVRLYSKKGFVERLSNAGFKVEQLSIDYFGKETFIKSSIPERSVLYIVRK